ncbi:unnamed protein product [Phytomonas sp. Hart1]|nr:unnamed protein product [Phytomonas sp. Hart1]|eukprot:CCW70527.1 unnamed protein product [Phytomonas sp. isolate Hart1]
MDIDLSNRNIPELCFDEDAITQEEALATAAVGALSVTRNRITRIQGLDTAFSNLTRLDLSYNVLGTGTTLVPACFAMAERGPTTMHGHDNYCEGIAQWIVALPRTLESLDVSHNCLSSFAYCSCTSNGRSLSSSTVSAAAPSDFYIRYLRHACPLTLSLFFDSHRFPKLHHLNLSHNALGVSVSESDAMEGIWQRTFPKVLKMGSVGCYTCAVENLNVSYNTDLSCVNCFLFNDYPPKNDSGTSLPPSSLFGLDTLDLRGCNISDLVGLSGVCPFAPRLQRLELDGSPIKETILGSNHTVIVNIIKSLILSASMEFTCHTSEYELEGTNKASYQNVALRKVVQDLTQNHGDLFTESLKKHLASSTSSERAIDLESCAYASVLLEVIPSLKLLDGSLHVVECKEAIINATQRTLVMLSSTRYTHPSNVTSQPTTASLKPMDAPDADETRIGEGLHRIASTVMPQLHTRVWIGGSPSSQDPETTTPLSERTQEGLMAHEGCVNVAQEGRLVEVPLCPMSLPLGDGDTAAYDALCQRSQKLKRELLDSQKRCRSYTEQSKELQSQLMADRKHITDQHRDILRLRAERDLTQASLLALKKRLKKRQHELAYGVQALESRYSSMRKQAAMNQINQREKILKKKEKNLPKHKGTSLLSTIRDNCQSHHDNSRQIRSVVLREAAIQKKLRLQNDDDPLGFSTSRFHIGNGKAGGKYASHEINSASGANNVEDDESHHYLRSYPQQKKMEAQKAAHRYCGRISSNQYRQLCEAIRLADPSKASPSASGELPSGNVSAVEASKASNEGAADLRGLAEQNLSTLSLTELFEAAASIRHRQLALQQVSTSAFQEANALQPAINTASFEASTIIHATNTALPAFFKQKVSSQIIDELYNISDHRLTASDVPEKLHALSAKHDDSVFLSALDHVEIPSSISLAGDNDIETGGVDALDSLNVFGGDESIDSHHSPSKANSMIHALVNQNSVNRGLF